MPGERTNAANNVELEQSEDLDAAAPGGLTAVFASTAKAPAVPFYAVVDYGNAAKIEFVRVTGKTATTLTFSSIAERYLEGSAAPGGITHLAGAKWLLAPTAQNLDDLWDAIEELQALEADVAAAQATADAAMPKAGGTFTGAVELGDNEVRQPRFKDYSEVYVDRGDVTGAVAIDVSAGNVQRLRAIGNVTLSFTNWPAGAVSLTLILVQDGTGSRTWTFPAAVKTPGGTGLGLSSAAGARDRVVLMTEDAGVTIDAAAAGKAFA